MVTEAFFDLQRFADDTLVGSTVDSSFRWAGGGSFGGYAMTIINDEYATESEKREAFRCMKRATELAPDDGFWWYRLGLMYRFGEGTKKNLAEAFSCFKQGNKAGNSASANQLGIMFSNGEHVAQNFQKAINFFEKAIELDGNNVNALNNLADCYRYGDGTAKDSYKAFELYKKAAELGHIGAMTTVGFMLFTGKGTRENEYESFK